MKSNNNNIIIIMSYKALHSGFCSVQSAEQKVHLIQRNILFLGSFKAFYTVLPVQAGIITTYLGSVQLRCNYYEKSH